MGNISQRGGREMDLILVTEKGVIKKTALDQYRSQARGGVGVTGISVGEMDRVAGVAAAGPDQDLLIVTEKGMSIRIPGSQVRAIGRTGAGVRGIRLREGDRVVGVVVV